MNKFTSFVVVGFLLLLLSSSAQAEEKMGPADTVREIVGRIKTEGTPVPVVDYVDWNKAFKDFPENERAKLGIDTAPELKEFFTKMLRSPSSVLKSEMEARIAEAPEGKQEEMRMMVGRMEEVMKKKEEELKERIATTEYSVGEETIDNNSAIVKLSQTYRGEERTEDVKLELDKEQGRWLLPSVQLAQSKSKPSSFHGSQPSGSAKP